MLPGLACCVLGAIGTPGLPSCLLPVTHLLPSQEGLPHALPLLPLPPGTAVTQPSLVAATPTTSMQVVQNVWGLTRMAQRWEA